MRRVYSNSNYKPRSIRRSESKAKKNIILSLVIIVLVLYLLITWGLPIIIGSLSFLNKTSSTPKDIVEDTAIAPPVLNIPFDATNSATIKISGYSNPSSKVEIYFDEDLKQTVDVNSDGSFKTDDLALSLGTNNIYGKTIDDAGKKSLSSKNIKVYYNNDKPKLEISSPQDNQEIKGGDKKIKVTGKTDPDNSITVNGSTVIVGNEGSFSTDIGLNDGDNSINVTSSNQFGNTNSQDLKVKYSAS